MTMLWRAAALTTDICAAGHDAIKANEISACQQLRLNWRRSSEMQHGPRIIGTLSTSIVHEKRLLLLTSPPQGMMLCQAIGYAPADSFASIGDIAWRCSTAWGSLESLQLHAWRFSPLTIGISTAEHDAMPANRPRTSPLLRTSRRRCSGEAACYEDHWIICTFPVFDRS